MILSTLRDSCIYYLGYGNRSKEGLLGKNEQYHINEMKKNYNGFTEDKKPEWITMNDILDYEKKMVI